MCFSPCRFKLAALLEKRAVCSWRDWGATATQLVVPLLLVIAALYARTSTVRIDQLPHMAINRKHSVFGLPAALSVSPMVKHQHCRPSSENMTVYQQPMCTAAGSGRY